MIQTPDCPRCHTEPLFRFDNMYICGNNECRVISWIPSMTIAENIASETPLRIMQP